MSEQSDGAGTTSSEPMRCISRSLLDRPEFWRLLIVCVILLAGGVSSLPMEGGLISVLIGG